jgi:hypothetical protein
MDAPALPVFLGQDDLSEDAFTTDEPWIGRRAVPPGPDPLGSNRDYPMSNEMITPNCLIYDNITGLNRPINQKGNVNHTGIFQGGPHAVPPVENPHNPESWLSVQSRLPLRLSNSHRRHTSLPARPAGSKKRYLA